MHPAGAGAVSSSASGATPAFLAGRGRRWRARDGGGVADAMWKPCSRRLLGPRATSWSMGVGCGRAGGRVTWNWASKQATLAMLLVAVVVVVAVPVLFPPGGEEEEQPAGDAGAELWRGRAGPLWERGEVGEEDRQEALQGGLLGGGGGDRRRWFRGCR